MPLAVYLFKDRFILIPAVNNNGLLQLFDGISLRDVFLRDKESFSQVNDIDLVEISRFAQDIHQPTVLDIPESRGCAWLSVARGGLVALNAIIILRI